MLKIRYSNQFKKDYKLAKKRGYDIEKLEIVVRMLLEGKSLPPQYKEHCLSGNYRRV